MRSHLLAAVALGPLCLAAIAVPASAATIASNTSTPIVTSRANNGTPDDVTINSEVSVTPAGGPAVTIDSNNSVSNAGLVELNNVSNSTTVLINGGVTGNLTNTGTINNIEDFDPKDSNNDGVVEAPLAIGSGRFGVRVVGSAPVTGTISNSGAVFAEGADSAGISVEAPLTGSILNSGTIGVTGDRAFGLRTTAPVSGDVNVSGIVSTSGQGSTAVSVGGDVGGGLRIYSTVNSNAYAVGARATVDAQLKAIQSTPSELQQAGSALVVGASLAKGLYIGAPPAGTVAGATVDLDGDGIADGSEGTGVVSEAGSAPAVLIGGQGRNISLGAFGTGDNAYGFILRGQISATGIYDGISATGVQIGGTGGAASLEGGLRLVGPITVTAYEAPATGVRVGAGGAVPEFRNENALSASILHSGLSPVASATATALQIDAGASLPRITNSGAITAAAVGPSMNATAVGDASGTLSNIENQGQISATLAPVTAGDSVGGRAIALDLRANTSGVTLRQETSAAAGAAAPAIIGDVLLGNGPNTVQLLGGGMAGALSLGSGPASFTIDNGAAYAGALSHSGPSLAVNVANGVLIDTNPTPLQATSLNVGANSTVSFAVDPAGNRSTSFQVSGPATLASGAKIGLNLVSAANPATQTFTLVSSPQLHVGALQSLSQTPFVTIADLSVDSAAGALNLTLRRRTPAEAGLNAAEAAAYDAILTALPGDPAVLEAVNSQTDRSGFIGLYDQIVPGYSGGVFRLASLASRAVSRAAAEGGAGNAWIQEITVASQLKSGHGALPFRGSGFGLAGGVERDTSFGALGVTAAAFNGDVHNPDLPGDDNATSTSIEGGLMWRANLGALRLDARAAGGYVHYREHRQFVITDATGATTLSRMAEGSSSGWTLAARLGARYRASAGRLFLEPGVHLDYFRMSQGAFTESGGGDALNMAFDPRTGDEVSGAASVRAGAEFGQDFRWRPEIELGYRETFSGTPGETVARSAAGGESFTLEPAAIEKGGAFGRVGVTAGDESFELAVSAGAEVRGGYTEGDLHFRVRLLF